MADFQIDVVVVGDARHKQVIPGIACPLCGFVPSDTDIVVRFEDFTAGPGIHQHVIHKACLQLVMDCTADPPPFIAPWRNMTN